MGDLCEEVVHEAKDRSFEVQPNHVSTNVNNFFFEFDYFAYYIIYQFSEGDHSTRVAHAQENAKALVKAVDRIYKKLLKKAEKIPIEIPLVLRELQLQYLPDCQLTEEELWREANYIFLLCIGIFTDTKKLLHLSPAYKECHNNQVSRALLLVSTPHPRP